MKVLFKRFCSKARGPEYSTPDLVDYDLFSARNVIIEPYSTLRVKTDLAFNFSKKYFAKIYSRSELSSCSIETGVGVVDSDYRGKVKVVLHNLCNKQAELDVGDMVAQVVFQKVEFPILEEASDLDSTELNKRDLIQQK